MMDLSKLAPMAPEEDAAPNVKGWEPNLTPSWAAVANDEVYDPYSTEALSTPAMPPQQSYYRPQDVANSDSTQFLKNVGSAAYSAGQATGVIGPEWTDEQLAGFHGGDVGPLIERAQKDAETFVMGTIGNGPHLPEGGLGFIDDLVKRARAGEDIAADLANLAPEERMSVFGRAMGAEPAAEVSAAQGASRAFQKEMAQESAPLAPSNIGGKVLEQGDPVERVAKAASTDNAAMGELMPERTEPFFTGGKPPKGGEQAAQAMDNEIVKQWHAGNRAILDRISNDEGFTGTMQKMLLNAAGDPADSFLASALHRKALLRSALDTAGMASEDIQKITSEAFDKELATRYGDKVPDDIKALIQGTYGAFGEGSKLGGLDTFIQRSKNTQFGVGDIGVFGVQILNALRRGSVPLMAGGINRTLAALHLPSIATELADSTLTKTQQLILDGVHQGIGSSGAMPEVGTVLSYLGAPGRKIDSIISPALNAMTRIQFQNILGPVRNLAYEGDLVMLKALGRDIQNPAVRAEAAANANVLSSFAEQALNAGRRKGEARAFTSSAMTRSRIRSITQMAKLISPKATPEQRILAASTIASTYGVYAMFGKWLNDQIGTSDLELDPSKMGFGVITSKFKGADGKPLKIDIVPQDSVERAFALSLKELTAKETDYGQIQRAWERVALGSGSIATRGTLAAGFRTGFDPDNGSYNYGNLPGNAVAQAFLPTPPILGSIGRGQTSPLELGLSATGISNYTESTPAKAAPAKGGTTTKKPTVRPKRPSR